MPKDERYGKRYIHVDATGQTAPTRALTFDTTTYDLVPVRPKGWMIEKMTIEGPQWVFGALIIPWNTCMEWVRHKFKQVSIKNAIFGEDICQWIETDVSIPERERPGEARTMLIDEMDARDEARKKTSEPKIPRQKQTPPPLALPPAKLDDEPPLGDRRFFMTPKENTDVR